MNAKLTRTANVKVKLDPGAAMPTRAHDTDVGYDVKALRTWLVQGDGTEHEIASLADCVRLNLLGIDCAKVKIDTGVHVTPQDGYYIGLVPNSRLAKTPFMYANSFGVIDPTYTGSMRVILNVVNHITPANLSNFLPGKVVGQLIIRERIPAAFEQVDELEATERGDGGFGSTAETKSKASCFSCKHLLSLRECAVHGNAPENLESCDHYCRTAGKGDA